MPQIYAKKYLRNLMTKVASTVATHIKRCTVSFEMAVGCFYEAKGPMSDLDLSRSNELQ